MALLWGNLPPRLDLLLLLLYVSCSYLLNTVSEKNIVSMMFSGKHCFEQVTGLITRSR